jgi:hypothetical protein
MAALNQAFENDLIWLTAVEPLKNGEALSAPMLEALKIQQGVGAITTGGGAAGGLFPAPKIPEEKQPEETPVDGSAPEAAPDPSLDPTMDGSSGPPKWELRILGNYRTNAEDQQIVYKYVRRLAELKEFFDKDNIDVKDKLNDFCKAEAGENRERYAYKFEIRLPLANPMQFTPSSN